MYKLRKQNIKGISPIIIENAKSGKVELYISGNYYQNGIPTENNPIEIQTVNQQVNIKIYNQKVYNSSILNSLLGLVLGYKKPNGKEYILPIQQEMLIEDTFEKDENGNWYEVHNWTKINSYNNEPINTEFISTTGKLTQGATVYYKKDIQERIECTNEQKEILNSFELYEGFNYILANTINMSKPYINFSYDVELTDELKNAFLTKIVKAYVVRTRDGFVINQDNYLKNFKLEDLRFIPDNGFLGGTVARRLTIDFNNVNNEFNIQDEDLKFYISVEYNNVEYFLEYGNFIVQKPDTENTTDNTSFEALDYMCKFNQPYIDEIKYPCKLIELAENVCKQAGVELGNKDFKNANFIVTDNQFVGGETLRVVLGAIALSAFSFARIGQDNKVYIDFEKKENSDISLNADKYYNLSFASKEYGPINKIILRNSQVEGENVTIQDDESIEKNGLHELVISDNPFAYTQEKRLQLIEAGREMFGFHYMPINSMNSLGYAFLDSTSLIKIEDMQGNEIYSYTLNHTIDYDGTILDEIACPALTETETKYTYTPEILQKLQKTEFIVDKQNQTITGIIEQQTETGNKLTKVEQDIDGITQTVSSVEEQIDENNQNISQTNQKVTQIEQTVEGVTQTVENVQTNLNENYSTTEQMNSAIEQSAGEINLEVSQKIDNIQVGAANLIPNSAPYNLEKYIISNTDLIELRLQDEETAPSKKCLCIRTLEQLTSTQGIYVYPTSNLKEGLQYCFSIWIRATANTNLTVGVGNYGTTAFNVTTEYQKFNYKFTATDSDIHGFAIYLPINTIAGRQIFVHSIMLEEGNQITSWSPAPDDNVNGSEIISRINMSPEEIQISSNKININGTISANGNFKVDTEGNMQCNNAIITGGKIRLGGTESNSSFIMTGQISDWGEFEASLYPSGLSISKVENDSTNERVRAGIVYSNGVQMGEVVLSGESNDVTFIYANGIITPSVQQTSLESIKKNILHYDDNALEMILNSRIYSYNLKSEKDTDKKHIGFVIGDKYKTPKEIMNNEENAIELYSAIGVLWKGIQEQQKKIEELENKVKEVTNGK